MTTTQRTTPPGKYVILYDGRCRFCTSGARRLESWMRRGAVERADFQQPEVLARFPGLSYEACMERLHLVTPDGRIFGGAEAIVQALATRRVLGRLAYLYYLPGLRWLLDRLYGIIAANRYRLLGRSAAERCDGGTCALHFRPPGAARR